MLKLFEVALSLTLKFRLFVIGCGCGLFFSVSGAESPTGNLAPAAQVNLVKLQGNSFRDNSGPFLGLGASYFQALRDAKYDRPRLIENLGVLASNRFNYIRILTMVGWDGLEIAPTTFTNRLGRTVEAWPDYWSQFGDLLQLATQNRLRVEITIFADAQHVMPSRKARLEHIGRVLANIQGIEDRVVLVEIANEAWQNGFPGKQGVEDLRDFAKYAASRTRVLVAISSSEDTSNQGIASLYRGTAASLATVHFSRDIHSKQRGWLPVLVGISAFRYLRDILPADIASWSRNDGIEQEAPFTVFCDNRPNQYWTEENTSTNGCIRNIGCRKGEAFVCLPMGILPGGLVLEARHSMGFDVFDLLTGTVLQERELHAGMRLVLPQGSGAYIVKGNIK